MRSIRLGRATGVLIVGLAVSLAAGSVFAAERLRTAEEARDALRTMAQNLAALDAGNPDVALRAARLQENLDRMTPLQIDLLAKSLAAAPGALDNVDRFNQKRAEAAPAVADSLNARTVTAAPEFSETCGDTRPDAATVADQLAMWQSLAAAAAAAQATCDGADDASVADACDVAGMAADAALMAQFTYEQSVFCSADIDSAIADATLDTLAEHDNSVQSLIQAESQLLREQLDLVLTNLSQHDTAVQSLIQAESQLTREQLDLVLNRQTEILEAVGSLMESQQEIVDAVAELRQLLLTPQGRRPGWNDRGNGNGNGNGN